MFKIFTQSMITVGIKTALLEPTLRFNWRIIMITTKSTDAILPLDLSSIAQLLHAPEGEFTPLAYDITEHTTDHVTISINITQCDPDSIQILPNGPNLQIKATANVQFMNSPADTGMVLTRDCIQRIPLSPGINLSQLRSQINDDVLSIHIPFQ